MFFIEKIKGKDNKPKKPTCVESCNWLVTSIKCEAIPTWKREKITENVKNLSYKEIKEKLKAKGKSSRGYLRTTIEKRLINVLLSE